MSQDNVSDALNQIMNALKAKKNVVRTRRYSKLLLKVLDIMKQNRYIDYSIENDELKITLLELNECRAIKPRYTVDKKSLEKYTRRFLPSRNFGYVIISTNKGLLTHKEAKENQTGGCLIAYVY